MGVGGRDGSLLVAHPDSASAAISAVPSAAWCDRVHRVVVIVASQPTGALHLCGGRLKEGHIVPLTAGKGSGHHVKLHRGVHRDIHARREAVLKLPFLVLNLAAKEWRMPAREWTAAKAQFAILFEDRFAIT